MSSSLKSLPRDEAAGDTVPGACHELASDLGDGCRVICMDWVGRGRSGWLASEGDYSLATYAEQLRQIIMHLGGRPVTVLGSSLGGSAAIEMTARYPELVKRLILN